MEQNYRCDYLYEGIGKQQAKELHTKYYEIQKKKEELDCKPLNNVIKAGTYIYDDCKKEKNEYEDKVNEILNEFNIQTQNNVDKLVKTQDELKKKTKELLEKNQPQRSVDDMLGER